MNLAQNEPISNALTWLNVEVIHYNPETLLADH